MVQFASWQEFVWMSGHGPYVWAVYALTVATVAAHALGLRQQRQRTLQAVAKAETRRDG